MAKLSYIKIGDSYEEASNVYIKENDSWVERDIVNIYWKGNSWSQATSAPKSAITSTPVVIHDYSQDYLTFKILSDGYINWKYSGSTGVRKTISYSTDNGATWASITPTTTGSQINVSTGDKVLFKANNNYYATASTNFNTFSASTSDFDIEGNIMSLFYGDDFADKTALPNSNYSCTNLFAGTMARNAKNLILPATTLRNYCYQGMFANCQKLTRTPQLPATTLASSCYYNMFNGCASLTTAPELPATTLVSGCYNYMFRGCSSLNYIKALFTTEPSTAYTNSWVTDVTGYGIFIKNDNATWDVTGNNGVPTNWTTGYTDYSGETLTITTSFTPSGYVTFTPQNESFIGLAKKYTSHTVYFSYNGTDWGTPVVGKFYHFTKTNKIYVCGNLTSNSSSSNNTRFMFSRGLVSGSGNCNSIWNYSNLNATLRTFCGCQMFYGCSNLTTAPELPARTLASNCYNGMFSGCTSLTTAPELPATTSANYCYYGMFSNCTSLTTAPELPATTLATSCYGAMFSGCTNLTTVSELPATTLAPNCYYRMFYGCTSLTTAPELPATTLTSQCYDGMFSGCTSLTSASELPATILTSQCYQTMFSNCTSLTTAPELPATTLVSSCYFNMFYGCTNLNSITCLATNISATNCTSNWVSGVAASGTFTKAASMTSWPSGTSGIPNDWTIVDAT